VLALFSSQVLALEVKVEVKVGIDLRVNRFERSTKSWCFVE